MGFSRRKFLLLLFITRHSTQPFKTGGLAARFVRILPFVCRVDLVLINMKETIHHVHIVSSLD
jgi:hypothetical protein